VSPPGQKVHVSCMYVITASLWGSALAALWAKEKSVIEKTASE